MADHIPEIVPFSPEQRLGALEQDMREVKTTLLSVTHEIALWRERYHDNVAPVMQSLVIKGEESAKTIGEIKTSLATMAVAWTGTIEKLDGHMKECAEASKIADKNRRYFRKEIRGYFVSLFFFAIGLYLSQRYHLGISIGP